MFTIFACIKYVKAEMVSMDLQYGSNYAINPYDLFMLEQLVELKKKYSCRIVGVTMGPMSCLQTLQRGIALGLDDVYLVSDTCFSASDTYATSYILSKALTQIGPADLYAFGERAIDGETGQVPIGIASRLDLQCITGVKELIAVEKEKAVIKRQFAEKLETMEITTPCVLSFRGFKTKELPISLLKLKQSQRYSPIVLNREALQIEKQYCGQHGSKTIVKNIAHTIPKNNNTTVEYIEGTPQAKADTFRKLILEKEKE